MKRRFSKLIYSLIFYVFIPAIDLFSADKYELIPIKESRVEEIACILPDTLKGLGNTYKDRNVWDVLYESGAYKTTIKNAEDMLNKGFPVWDESLYNPVFTEDDTQSGKDMINRRLKALSELVWAECLENRNRFTSSIIDFLYDIIEQKTWVNPRNYNRKNYGGLVELATALNARSMAQAVYLLDDKLPLKVRADVRNELYIRAFNPLLRTIKGENMDHDWLFSTGNWNPVCLEGITCAALSMIPDKKERALFIAISELYVQNYAKGFLPDGYCSEGINYYNFGMSHYIVLREKIWQDTGGKIDIFRSNPNMLNVATFLPRMEIINNVYPAIADCEMGMKPSRFVLHYLSKLYGLQLPADEDRLLGVTDDLSEHVLVHFPNSTDCCPVNNVPYSSSLLRSSFPDAGVFIFRTLPNTIVPMGVAIKGGNNGEHHNHNDVGSYTLVIGKEMMVEDPGLIPYTKKTFSAERYTAFKSLASYGHPVPFVAEGGQRVGKMAKARILHVLESDSCDQVMMDITSAYGLSVLKSLLRKFTFYRDAMRFEVKDCFEFSLPHLFETALITRADWKRDGDNRIILERNKEKIIVEINVSSGKFSLYDERICEGGEPYTRLAIRIDEPMKKGSVDISFRVQ